MPLAVLSAATLIIAEAGAASGLPGGVVASIVGCAAGTALLYFAARLARGALVRLLPPQLLDFAHPIGAGLLMVFTLAMSTVGFWAYGPLFLKLLFDTKPLVTGYILAGEAIAWSVATMAVSRVTPADDQWAIRGGGRGLRLRRARVCTPAPGRSPCGPVQGAALP